MGILLGGPKCYAKRTHKDLMVFFEWFDNDTNELGKGEPALFITRRDKFGLSGNRGSACILLPAAWKYADSKSGNPTRRLIKFASDACAELGLEPSKGNVFRIADAIVENLPDLLRMPPEPSEDQFYSRRKRPAGELVVKADGATVLETVVH